MYRKIHITPNEVFHWGITVRHHSNFDTDCGKIGIVICYDVEFPELSRLMADEGMNILFVPFLTDTQNGYTRVKHCAQARAIENECYVALVVLKLTKGKQYGYQYAQAAVFTPSDFAFQVTESRPKQRLTEMTLIVDVDMNLLKELHEHGSEQP
jgi:predicted amidohydrolase